MSSYRLLKTYVHAYAAFLSDVKTKQMLFDLHAGRPLLLLRVINFNSSHAQRENARPETLPGILNDAGTMVYGIWPVNNSINGNRKRRSALLPFIHRYGLKTIRTYVKIVQLRKNNIRS